MTPHDSKFSELLPAYAAGALDEAELETLERHLQSGCAECEAELLSWSGVADELALAASPIPVSNELRTSFMNALESEPARQTSNESRDAGQEFTGGAATTRPEESQPTAANANRGWLGLAAALLVATIGWGLWSQSNLRAVKADAAREKEGLERALARAEELLSSSEQELELARAAQEIVAAAGVESVSLASTAAGDAMTARSYADPATGRAVVYASRLPEVDADRTYQLWFIRAGAPVSAGVFEADDGNATIVVTDLTELEAIQGWAISVEPRGGSEQPTGPIVLSS